MRRKRGRAKKWGKIGAPRSKKRRSWLSRIRRKRRRKRRRKKGNPRWVRGRCVL